MSMDDIGCYPVSTNDINRTILLNTKSVPKGRIDAAHHCRHMVLICFWMGNHHLFASTVYISFDFKDFSARATSWTLSYLSIFLQHV